MQSITKVIFLFFVFVATACSAQDMFAYKVVTLSSKETKDLLKKMGRNAESSQWQLEGKELRYLNTNCAFERDLLIYSKPSLIDHSIYLGKLTRLRSEAENKAVSSCEKLVNTSIYNNQYAIFSDSNATGDLQGKNKVVLLDSVDANTLKRVSSLIGELSLCLNDASHICKLNIDFVPNRKFLQNKLTDISLYNMYTIGLGPGVGHGDIDLMVSFNSANESHLVASFRNCKCDVSKVSISLLLP